MKKLDPLLHKGLAEITVLFFAFFLIFAFSQEGFAQPRIEAFTFRIAAQDSTWRVDVYLKTGANWLTQMGVVEKIRKVGG